MSSDKIISRSYSAQGRKNHERIFGKNKKDNSKREK